MKKFTILTLTLCFLLAGLTACSDTAKPTAANPVTLNIWHVYGSQTRSPLNDTIDEFNNTVGRDNGITVNVVSVTSSSAIDEALSASANGEPGAEDLPDLFTAYPRVVEIVGSDRLLAWNDYFSEEELAPFKDTFLSEGYFGGELLMLPIAKSSEALFLNKTLFDRFSADAGASMESLSTFDGLFKTATLYYDWSGGQNFTQLNDCYNYALVGMKAHNSDFIRDGKLQLSDPAFEKIWRPLAGAAIYGGICLDDGYAAARWKTGEIISNIGSSADILYQPEVVYYPDNTSEPIVSVSLPYPVFSETTAVAVHRGGGLFATKSDDAKKNYAAYIFAKWITEKENNLNFVTSTGYLPVTDDAFTLLFDNVDIVSTEGYRELYGTLSAMLDTYELIPLPLYDGASQVQADFEKHVKLVLKSAHIQYEERIALGENRDTVLNELIDSSLEELKRLSAKNM